MTVFNRIDIYDVMCDVRVFNYVCTLSVVYFVANYVHVFFLFIIFLLATFHGEIKTSIVTW